MIEIKVKEFNIYKKIMRDGRVIKENMTKYKGSLSDKESNK